MMILSVISVTANSYKEFVCVQQKITTINILQSLVELIVVMQSKIWYFPL